MVKKALLILALSAMIFGIYAEEIGGKFAFGFEQGIGTGANSLRELGRGCSFKLCLSNNVAIKGAVGINYSQKAEETNSTVAPAELIYKEDKDRIDYTAALYGILVFRRFKKVHLNGMTGLLVAYRDNHFDDEMSADTEYNNSYTNSGEQPKSMNVHLRILMAPEIFLFPNFSLEYKYGFDISLKNDRIEVADPHDSGNHKIVERNRLHVDIMGDLNLVNSASVHFYF